MTPEACLKKANEIGVAAVLHEISNKVRVRLPMSRAFLKLPIDDLPLSVRSRNALMRTGLDTVDKLVAYIRDNESMASIRNLGKKSILEVKTVLTEAAYSHLTEQEKLAFWVFTSPIS